MSAKASLEDLRERLDAVLPALASIDVAGLVAALHPIRGSRFAVTGIGASRVAARLLASTLHDLGVPARFIPLSAFAEGTFSARADEALCVFSQSLSPNARLALRRAGDFLGCHLFTSLPAGAAALESFGNTRVHVVTLPPERESPSLLRVVGPCVAMVAATVFAHAVAARPLPHRIDELVARLENARRASRAAIDALPEVALDAPVAFIVGGGCPALADGLAIKWLEGLGGHEPPTWDALEIAHGPFQSFHAEPRLLVALGPHSPLHDRLASMLDPARQVLLRFASTVDPPFQRVEVEVCANELLVAAFARRPRDLFRWPSQGKDGPLYGLCEEVEPRPIPLRVRKGIDFQRGAGK